MVSLALSATLASQPTLQAATALRPKLVVVISIDQFRGDYTTRFADHYLPAQSGKTVGGFNYLTQKGAYYPDAHYNHIPTETGPGHAIVLTGSVPGLTGIIGNDWFDRKTSKSMYCVSDPSVTTVGGNSGPMSPKNLLVTTLGDELKMATNGKAKVVGISFKDRAAILMAGHAADQVLWFDNGTANWVTSSFYNSKLPAWASDLNSKQRPKGELNQVWTPLLPESAYAWTRKSPAQKDSKEPVFSHALTNIGLWTTSPQGQKYVFDTAKIAIGQEGLGLDSVPDVLAINLATNDYVGHVYGPNSPQVLDISVHTDRMLSDFFNFLDQRVGLKNTVIAVTADHGVVPIVEEMGDPFKINATRIKANDCKDAAEAALDAQIGPADWIQAMDIPNVFINQATVAAQKVDPATAEGIAARAILGVPGIYATATRTQLLSGAVPRTPWGQRLINGFHPSLSGDVFVLNAPGTYFGAGTGTGHGSAWEYDTHVPILMSGFGIQSGVYSNKVSVSDIAPTLSRILRISAPNGSVGSILPGALKQ
ncbi:MAG: alkaline phosphatase family protein [Chthonomonas sp.]|nr:alkaline phosphatase family protein [Chthonomonas sp.]